MTQPIKCAHPACACVVPENGPHGKYCSDHCKEAGQISELQCGCQHLECRQPAVDGRATMGGS
jgi:hypothetical protein